MHRNLKRDELNSGLPASLVLDEIEPFKTLPRLL